jgi:hypothetical protein
MRTLPLRYCIALTFAPLHPSHIFTCHLALTIAKKKKKKKKRLSKNLPADILSAMVVVIKPKVYFQGKEHFLTR